MAPLSPLGDDPPRDEMMYERIEIWDGKDGTFLKELPVRPGWNGMAFSPDGTLHVIEKRHEIIAAVDLATGKLTPALENAQPSNFSIGPDGLFYVRPWDDASPIVVYDANGEKLREIGHAGGMRPGLWDPQRFGTIHRMCVDRKLNLWVVESQDNPRRIVQYRTDGTFVKEILGNTHYGGGGTLDRTNPSRAFHGNVEFELDWARHTSHIRAYLGETFVGGDPVVRKIDGRAYLTSAPLTLKSGQGVGAVHLYDEKTGTAKLVAAMGDAGAFAPLRRAEIIALLKGDVPKNYGFLWSDRDGNGVVNASEVEFTSKKTVWHSMDVGPFDERLGCCGSGAYFEVAEFTSAGVPVYRRTPAPGHPQYRLADGSFLTLHASADGDERSENYVSTAGGKKCWGYPASGGVSGLSIPGWEPGLVTNQFGIIGHETAKSGDLGEFFVIHDNTGQWRIWTADGLPAGNILYHKMDPRSRLLGPPDVKFGGRLDPLSASQEHFHGFFTGLDDDQRFYAIMGFTNMSIVEVRGIEKFRRAAGALKVTAADVDNVRAWQANRQRREAGGSMPVLVAREFGEDESPVIDGHATPGEWPSGPALPLDSSIAFCMGYDLKHLYACWTGKGAGPLRNDGGDFRRLFKTGACLDLQIGTDEKADDGRMSPARGDVRILIALVGNQATAVLYQPVAPGAKPAEAWTTRTAAAGETSFDRVALLGADTSIAATNARDFVVEVAIDLGELGLVPFKGMRVRGDWGVLLSGDGHQVKSRMYWSNTTATGTSDEAVEARLEPHNWGVVAFE